MKKNNLILICGTGSIARRHASNLLSLGYNNLIFFRETRKPIPKWIKKFKIFYSYHKAMKNKPKAVFICNVTSKHIKYALQSAKKKSHLFIEKPISNKIEGLYKLKKIIKKNKLKLMVGYMMRYHPLIKKIKKYIKKKYFGKIFYVYSTWSEYLPDWHPNENFRSSYAASKTLGGGSTLTLSHEIDLIKWFFGNIKKITTYKSFNSKLKIDSEFSTNHQVEFKKNIVAQIHLDYMQKPYERRLEIVGEKKKLLFNYYRNEIIITNRYRKTKKIIQKNFDRNDMFIEEIKIFFKSIKGI